MTKYIKKGFKGMALMVIIPIKVLLFLTDAVSGGHTE